MKFAVLAAADSWYLKDLKRAAKDEHDVLAVSFSDLLAEVSTDLEQVRCGETSLSDFDALIVRSMPPGSLEQVVFRMNALARLEAAGVAVVNSPRSLEIAIDKYLTMAKVAELRPVVGVLGALLPRTVACQTVEDAMRAFEQLGRDVVIKPVFGGEGRGITRISDPDLALRAFKMLVQMNAIIFQQEYIPHEGFDIRLFVFGGNVYGMKRLNPHDWRTNVSRGATTEPFEADERLQELACFAADNVGALIAGVDILPGQDGREYLLEVNAVPGWKALSQTLDVDVSANVLQCVGGYVRAQQRGRGK